MKINRTNTLTPAARNAKFGQEYAGISVRCPLGTKVKNRNSTNEERLK